MNKKAKLTQGGIVNNMLHLAIPMFVGIAGIVAFNLADTYFVGRLGTDALAAMSFTFPVIMVINSIAMGLGLGTTSVVSRMIGTEDRGIVKRITTDTLILGILIASVFIIIGFLTMKPLFTVLGAKGNVLELIISYMSVWYLGAGFVFIPMIGNSAIRGTGDTKTPSIIMLIAISLNVLLDPLLIFGFGFVPALGLKGAAIATISSRFFTMLAAFFVLIKREKLIEISKPVVSEVFNSWKKVLYIGVPASATNLIIPVSMGIITRLISGYGTVAVAGFGVAIRIEMFALSVIHALSSGMVPFVGQNFGAKKIDRVIKSIKHSHIFSVIYGLFSFTIFLLTAHLIAGIFDNNPDVINTTALYLHIVSVSFGFYGIMLISSSSFNAMNKPYPAIMIAFLRMFIIYIPLAFIGSRLFSIKGIFISAALSNFIAGTVAYFWIKRTIGTTSLNDFLISSRQLEK